MSDIEATLDMLDAVVKFAYEHGYHEHGVSLVAEVRDEMTTLQRNASRLVALVWALGNWNDHNWSDGDYRRWRDSARALCEEMAPSLPDPVAK